MRWSKNRTNFWLLRKKSSTARPGHESSIGTCGIRKDQYLVNTAGWVGHPIKTSPKYPWQFFQHVADSCHAERWFCHFFWRRLSFNPQLNWCNWAENHYSHVFIDGACSPFASHSNRCSSAALFFKLKQKTTPSRKLRFVGIKIDMVRVQRCCLHFTDAYWFLARNDDASTWI